MAHDPTDEKRVALTVDELGGMAMVESCGRGFRGDGDGGSAGPRSGACAEFEIGGVAGIEGGQGRFGIGAEWEPGGACEVAALCGRESCE
jgi:hypothetical protein